VIRLLYFAWVRERIGRAEEEVALPPEVRTVADLCDWLAARSEGHAMALADRDRLRLAVNQDYADWSAPLAAGDEVAIFPPVTGG